MTLSLSEISVPVFVRTLEALSGVLDKAAGHCAAKKIDPAVMAATRLIPDMFALSRQVQIACDFAKNATARLAGVEAPRFEDDETTLDQLKARIAKTVDFLRNVDAAAIDAGGSRQIVFPVGPNKMQMGGTNYLVHFAMPNFHFHIVAAYAILRAAGVEIGKRDFMGAVPDFLPAA
ncbi:DUF1993 domain-containing protein [Prosthecomicrobium hirschii]|uniref:DUF1993 domain-containing protein n=1 Tax=Prosthecodimorpha hirschii TaxID=665126 RepID=UPI00112EB204|nr:DUF1993 domain-containing protein [Prosthecomicrobium hirschii]TPQ48965.1 DUF1993 domain-containing protein [Prosthecomicrobium hirschii]